MQVSREDLKGVMHQKTDDELRAILFRRSQDFTQDAIAAAKEEFTERRLNPDEAVAERGAVSEARGTVARIPQQQGKAPFATSIKVGFVVLILSVVLNGAAAAWKSIHEALNEQGWLQHEHDTAVWIKGEWLTGEFRVCEMPASGKNDPLPGSAHLICAPGDGGEVAFSADITIRELAAYFARDWPVLDQHFHVIPVSYWGRVDRSDRWLWQAYNWRCVRREDWNRSVSLKCWALD